LDALIRKCARRIPPLRFGIASALALAAALAIVFPAEAGVIVNDTQVNNTAGDPAGHTTQNETSLAVNGSTICAGFNDSGGAQLSGFARSTDGGANWADQGELPGNPLAPGNANNFTNDGDPALAVNLATGVFYYGENATSGDSNLGISKVIVVARSTDGCQTFPRANQVVVNAILNTNTDRTTFSDKPSVAVDNSGTTNPRNVYVCWTRFVDTDNNGAADASELRFARSTDGGLTYGNEQVLQANGPAPFGCSVKVGPAGQVYVSWADRNGPTNGDIRIRVSTDGGLTFGTNTPVSTGNRQAGTDRMVACGANTRPTLNGDVRMLHQSWIAVDTTGGPNNGNVYAVWASDPTGNTDNSDVFFSRSINGGANWSTPVQLGGGTTTDQFEPNVAVGGANGTVTVAWYDRRNDTANNRTIDVYKAFSTDGGATFGNLVRVTNQSFDIPALNPGFDTDITTCYMGEYIGVAGDAGAFYYMWGDDRNLVDAANFPPNGRPDPDVFFESEKAPEPLTATCSGTAAVNPFNNTAIVSFTDPDTAAVAGDYTATIDWGDTTSSAGTVTGPTGGPFTVRGSHTYAALGPYTISVRIDDADGSYVTKSCPFTTFRFAPGRGAFVIGDRNSAIGTAVTFWGAQWWSLNQLTGGPTQAAFKGYALNPATPACNVRWSTDPGNSAPPPPGPLPSYMGVIATSSMTKAGSQISGTTPHIVVVQTNPGYGPAPGKAGTGTVVGQFC
jgi:hypothetical protein